MPKRNHWKVCNEGSDGDAHADEHGSGGADVCEMESVGYCCNSLPHQILQIQAQSPPALCGGLKSWAVVECQSFGGSA